MGTWGKYLHYIKNHTKGIFIQMKENNSNIKTQIEYLEKAIANLIFNDDEPYNVNIADGEIIKDSDQIVQDYIIPSANRLLMSWLNLSIKANGLDSIIYLPKAGIFKMETEMQIPYDKLVKTFEQFYCMYEVLKEIENDQHHLSDEYDQSDPTIDIFDW